MAEKGTPEFYRQEAHRVASLASTVTDPGIRLEMLRIAAGFKTLAEYTAAHVVANETRPKVKSA
jgi:hypothetical protein